mmetsp:Transcript_50325/g.150359  ORF Transcript_50325/g.150359 Transcript_50325/m.150359 type:complete len:210 (-) Transcript_50325:176-805(-)
MPESPARVAMTPVPTLLMMQPTQSKDPMMAMNSESLSVATNRIMAETSAQISAMIESSTAALTLLMLKPWPSNTRRALSVKFCSTDVPSCWSKRIVYQGRAIPRAQQRAVTVMRRPERSRTDLVRRHCFFSFTGSFSVDRCDAMEPLVLASSKGGSSEVVPQLLDSCVSCRAVGGLGGVARVLVRPVDSTAPHLEMAGSCGSSSLAGSS